MLALVYHKSDSIHTHINTYRSNDLFNKITATLHERHGVSTHWIFHCCTAVYSDYASKQKPTILAHCDVTPPMTGGFLSQIACNSEHDDVTERKPFPRYWPFVRRIHRSPVNSPHKGLWRRALMFSLICAGIKGEENNREVGHFGTPSRSLWCHCNEAFKCHDIICPKTISTC